jgi:hypothetical protein
MTDTRLGIRRNCHAARLIFTDRPQVTRFAKRRGHGHAALLCIHSASARPFVIIFP